MDEKIHPAILEALRGALEEAARVKDDPNRFRVYIGRELDFVQDVFGIGVWSEDNPHVPGLTPDQVRFFLAIFEHRRVACRSGHGTGKSFVLGLAALVFMYTRMGRVVITASTWKQVEDVVFGEMSRMFRHARVPLPHKDGHPLQTELAVNEDVYAIGLSTNDPTAFQGRHYPDMLVIVDEAVGVDNQTHQAIRSLATGKRNHIVMVGNPTEVNGEFYEAFRSKTWFTMHMSCLDHPNVLLNDEVIQGAVTVEWVEEQRERYGEDSPIWQCRVLGEFPTITSNAVIPIHLAEAATRDTEALTQALVTARGGFHPEYWALDVSRYGDSRTVLGRRVDGAVYLLEDWSHKSTALTSARVYDTYHGIKEKQQRPEAIIVDESGVGGPVLDRLLELGLPAIGYHSGRPAGSKTLYGNRRAEDYWRIRLRLEKGLIQIPNNPELLSDLKNVTYKLSAGKIWIRSKEEMRADGIKSPDFADCLVMLFAVEGEPMVPVEPVPEGMDQNVILNEQSEEEQQAAGYFSALGGFW